MLINGQTPQISTYPFNSTSLMVVSCTFEGSLVNKYIAIDTEVEYTTASNEAIIGLVKSYNSIYDMQNNTIVEVPTGSNIRVIETGFSGITIEMSGDYGNNINILYDAADIQKHSSIISTDGFNSTNETDIVIDGENTIILTPQSGVIDGLGFWWSENIELQIEASDSLPRIDLVVLEKNQEQTTTNIVVKRGVAASSPEAPSITQEILGYYELPIMSIYVSASQTTLSRENITDLRGYTTKKQIEDNTINISKMQEEIFDIMFPIGTIHIAYTNTKPALGVWERFAEGRTIIGVGTSDEDFEEESTGGSSNVVLISEQMPSHNHSFTGTSHNHTFTGTSHTHSLSTSSHTHNIPASTGDFGAGYPQDADPSNTTHTTSSASASGSLGSTSAGGSVGSTSAGGTIGNTGSGSAHTNLQPYITTYMFKRIA